MSENVKYEVLKDFTDLTDNFLVYRKGKPYPQVGKVVSEGRIKELSTNKNKQGIPLIKKVEVDTVIPLKNRTVQQLKEIAEEMKLEDYSQLKKSELVELIKSQE